MCIIEPNYSAPHMHKTAAASPPVPRPFSVVYRFRLFFSIKATMLASSRM